jgi:predicted nucleic acid-binding protein
MPVKVVDASALRALVFGEPGAKTVAKQLAEFTLVAPHLLCFELASISFRKAAAHPDDAKQIREALRMAGRLAIQLLAVDHLEVIDLAVKDRLTTDDASCLWLARRTGGELVTLDKRLLKAFARKGP